MRRRDFLLTASVAAGIVAVPRLAPAQGAKLRWRADRVLVLVELAGGNDGLNTVIPYAAAAYARLRPQIAIARDAVIQLDERVGLHPSLAPLLDLWKAGEVAIVQGVGYERPNRSHFRSIDIWDTASGSDRYLSQGWVTRLLGGVDRPAHLLADAVVLSGGTGPVSGAGLRAVAMPDPERFLKQAEGMRAPGSAPANPALAHLLKMQQQVGETAAELRTVLSKAPAVTGEFPGGALGQQLKIAARLIASGAQVPVIKVALGGFDTHAGQPGPHGNLLKQVAESIAAFRTALLAAGQWQRVLVATYSEFGRRAAQNASNGTDHGTAAPHFLVGAAVKGGLYGPLPDLGNLANGDLRFGVDYREIYAAAAERWWTLPRSAAIFGEHRALPVLRA